MTGTVLELFPVPFYTKKTNLDCIDLKGKLDKLNLMNEMAGSEGYRHPLRDQLFENPDFHDTKDIIQREVDHFMREVLHYRYDESYFSCSWFNVNEPGSTHHRHYHPNSIISGVLYVHVPEGSGQLVFLSPHNNRDIVPDKKRNTTQSVFDVTSFFPVQEEGRLVLFPSYLEHLVSKNESNENRYTISFNVFVKGHLGNSAELTYCRFKS